MTLSGSASSSTTTLRMMTMVCSTVAVAASVTVPLLLLSKDRKRRRTQWQQDEEARGHEALHSIIAHFASLRLEDPETTVEEANKRRTASYYEKARAAHQNVLVRGVGNYSTLLKLRQDEIDGILYRYRQGTKSHRTVVAMCDATTATILEEARETILQPLQYSTDPTTAGVWIPELNIIPKDDMHVTVAIPWWWHTMREGNEELSKELAARFRQTLLLKFHHAFQIELERIVLLGGKTLVALWRCVGARLDPDGSVIYDRHGDSVDPFVRLRVEIVRCFTTQEETLGGQPLTYTDSMHSKQQQLPQEQQDDENNANTNLVIPTPPPPGATVAKPVLKRQHTIEEKTPGVGQGDGFIHTTLCRLPLECLSQHDVSLEKVHRLCREASATLGGHRMAVSKFRFIETVGRGGESNPCNGPIFDETIEAPSRIKMDKVGGRLKEVDNLHVQIVNNSSKTIGASQNITSRPSMIGLFDNSDVTIVEEAAAEDGSRNDSSSSVVTITAPMLI